MVGIMIFGPIEQIGTSRIIKVLVEGEGIDVSSAAVETLLGHFAVGRDGFCVGRAAGGWTRTFVGVFVWFRHGLMLDVVMCALLCVGGWWWWLVCGV